MSMHEIILALQAELDLLPRLGLQTVIDFFDLVHRLRRDIEVELSFPTNSTEAPTHLPTIACTFLKNCLGLSRRDIDKLWAVLRDLAWATPLSPSLPSKRVLDHFTHHGILLNLSPVKLHPPTRVCTNAQCTRKRTRDTAPRAQTLGEIRKSHAVLHTKDGPVPVITSSSYCRNCHTRYHHNYAVCAGSREYYETGVPAYIQTATHIFFERELCTHFTNLMLLAWTSATNCARIYNLDTDNAADPIFRPIDWPVVYTLDTERVWEALLLFWVLEDYSERDRLLLLPEKAESQAARLRHVMQRRNESFVGAGHPDWAHACDLCCWISVDTDTGNTTAIRSFVTDGVTLSHPCCAIKDCQVPLSGKKGARYCSQHQLEEQICAVISCSEPVRVGCKTCTQPEHRALEEYRDLQGKASFQLSARLRSLGASHSHDALAAATAGTSTGLEDQDTTVEGTAPGDDDELSYEQCEGKPATGNRPTRARFGRRRTHNEELCVGSCGVIIGRATFFGSEAQNGVISFWKVLFPTYASVPRVLWHDNNCNIVPVLAKETEEVKARFRDAILPVDVFHFKCKHKASHSTCNEHCNPMKYKEWLRDGDKWRFNSSAAEQANAWIGGFLPIVREMEVVRFNFFLDEMIKRRNRLIIAELRRKGSRPYTIPREALL